MSRNPFSEFGQSSDVWESLGYGRTGGISSAYTYYQTKAHRDYDWLEKDRAAKSIQRKWKHFRYYNNLNKWRQKAAGPEEEVTESGWRDIGGNRRRLNVPGTWRDAAVEEIQQRINDYNVSAGGGFGGYDIAMSIVKRLAKLIGLGLGGMLIGGISAWKLYEKFKAIEDSQSSSDNPSKKPRVDDSSSRFRSKMVGIRRWGRVGRMRAPRGKIMKRRRNRSSKGGSKGGAVTFQHDVVTTYRKKRFNRRRSRRGRKSWRSFNNKLLRYQGNNVFKRNYNVTVATVAGSQSVFAIPGLFSFYGTATTWDDLFALYTAYVLKNTGGAGNSVYANTLTGTQDINSATKFYISNARMEMDITNTGSTPCVAEIYLCKARKTNAEFGANPGVDFQFSPLRVTGTTALGGTSQYVTPFDATVFCQMYKILSCKKVYLQPGGATDMSISARGMTFDPKELNGVTANTKGMYEGKGLFWFVVGTGSPEVTAVTNARFSACSLSVTTQRHYNVKVMSATPTTASIG